MTQHVTRRIVSQYLREVGLPTEVNEHAITRAARYFESHPHEVAMILSVLNKRHLYDGIVADPCEEMI